MNPLHKLMAKKKSEGKKLSGAEKKGKEETLQSLIDEMMDMDSDKVKGLKKVTVASNSPSGLSKGLEKAKELIGGAPVGGLEGEEMEEEMPEGEEMMEEEEMPEGEEESSEMEDESPEELEAEIEKLKEKLAKLKK